MKDIYYYLWSKSSTNGGQSHPLWASAFDLFNVFLCLDRYSNENIIAEIAFFASMGELGKATPQFQQNEPDIFQRLIGDGLTEEEIKLPAGGAFLDLARAAALLEIFDEVKDKNCRRKLREFAMFIGMRGGSPFKKSDIETILMGNGMALGGRRWKSVRKCLFENVSEFLNINLFETKIDLSIGDMVRFAGLASLSDWIVSDDIFFPPIGFDMPPEEYLPLSRVRAKAATEAKGYSSRRKVNSENLTCGTKDLSAQFRIASESIASNGSPALTIIQAPAYERRFEAAPDGTTAGRGLFIARNDGFFSEAELVKTDAYLVGAEQAPIAANGSQNCSCDSLETGVDVFFKEKAIYDDIASGNKSVNVSDLSSQEGSFLSAQYEIGTPGDAYLGVLNSEFFFLRLAALSRKTVVFDDICAYDLYLRQPFLRTLEWLRALGTNVIVVAPALPQEILKDAMRAWDAKSIGAVPEYPSAVRIADGEILVCPVPVPVEKNIKIETHFGNMESAARKAAKAAESGLKVGVVLNTVKRAQRFFKALQLLKQNGIDLEIDLLHDQFAAGEMRKIAKRTLAKYGRNADSGGTGSVLVATPVAENCKEFDFDVVYSDLAPIDILIQRTGSLQRSLRERLSDAKEARFFILTPDARTEGIASLIESTGDYSQMYIYRTYAAIEAKKVWRFPYDCRPLIEAVYAGISPLANEELSNFPYSEDRDAINKALREYDFECTKARTKANYSLIPAPKDMWDFFDYGKFCFKREADAREDLKELFPKNRTGVSVASAIIIYKSRGEYFLDPNFSEKLERGAPEEKIFRGLLENAIGISDPRVIKYLKSFTERSLGAPPQFGDALKKYKYLILDENRLYLDKDYVKYDKELGLMIEGILKR